MTSDLSGRLPAAQTEELRSFTIPIHRNDSGSEKFRAFFQNGSWTIHSAQDIKEGLWADESYALRCIWSHFPRLDARLRKMIATLQCQRDNDTQNALLRLEETLAWAQARPLSRRDRLSRFLGMKLQREHEYERLRLQHTLWLLDREEEFRRDAATVLFLALLAWYPT